MSGLGDSQTVAVLRHSEKHTQTHKYVRLQIHRTSQTERQRAAEKEADEEEEDWGEMQTQR